MIHLAWLCSLVLGIGAAAVAMHQSIFLMRIDVLRNANDLCQHLLSHGVKSNGRRDVRLEQGILWQAAVGMLEWSIYTWMAGFLIFIGDLTRAESKHVVGNSPVVTTHPTHPSSIANWILRGCNLLLFGICCNISNLHWEHFAALVYGWHFCSATRSCPGSGARNSAVRIERMTACWQ